MFTKLIPHFIHVFANNLLPIVIVTDRLVFRLGLNEPHLAYLSSESAVILSARLFLETPSE